MVIKLNYFTILLRWKYTNFSHADKFLRSKMKLGKLQNVNIILSSKNFTCFLAKCLRYDNYLL